MEGHRGWVWNRDRVTTLQCSELLGKAERYGGEKSWEVVKGVCAISRGWLKMGARNRRWREKIHVGELNEID